MATDDLDHDMHTTTLNAGRLKSYIDRYERLELETKDLQEHKKELLSELKSEGYNPAIFKRVIKRRSEDPDKVANEEAEFEMYLEAVGQ